MRRSYSLAIILLLTILSCGALRAVTATLNAQFLASQATTELFGSNCTLKAFDSVATKIVIAAECIGSVRLPESCGYSNGDGDSSNGGSKDIFVAAFSTADLSCLWANSYYTNSADSVTDVSFASSGDNVVMSGYFEAQVGELGLRATKGAATSCTSACAVVATRNAVEGFVTLISANDGSCSFITRSLSTAASSVTMVYGARMMGSNILVALTTTTSDPSSVTVSTLNSPNSCSGGYYGSENPGWARLLFVKLDASGTCQYALAESGSYGSIDSVKLAVSPSGMYVSGTLRTTGVEHSVGLFEPFEGSDCPFGPFSGSDSTLQQPFIMRIPISFNDYCGTQAGTIIKG